MKNAQRGIWLGEVVISIGIIALVSITVIGLFSYLAVTSQTLSERAAAELLADSLMEAAVTQGPPAWGLRNGQLYQENPVEMDTGDGQAKEKLVFQVIPKKLDDNRLGELYRVRVRVSWQDGSDSRNVERGKGFLERMRTVYVEDV